MIMKNVSIFLFLLIFSASAFSQTYNGKFSRSDKNGRGEVSIQNIYIKKNKLLKFSFVALGKQRGTCVGEINGFAIWIDSRTAEFNQDGSERDPKTKELISCRITLIFLSSNRLKVIDKNCDDFHGAACTFEGTYRKN